MLPVSCRQAEALLRVPAKAQADVEVIPPTELKAVLEHRASKASTPILHTRGVESKVGRVPHVRDAPVWVVQTRLPGLNLVLRALTGAATSQ